MDTNSIYVSQIYSTVYRVVFSPVAMKRGLICTLFKVSRKYDDDRKNYREISLLTIITKLMERLLLNQFKGWLSQCDIKFPSVNQNTYQESLCSLLVSVGLQECVRVSHNLERDSNVYGCLLE